MIRLRQGFALMILVISGCALQVDVEADAADVDEFDYLKFDGNSLLSTHDIKLAMRMPSEYKLIKPISYQAVFNEIRFNVSVAGFVKGKTLLFVSAEKLTDNGGHLDYSHFEPTELNGIKFYKRSKCAELTPDDIEAAADLRYLKENGYDFHPTIYLTHFFQNSADGNFEYVVVFGEQVSSCSDNIITDAFKVRFNNKLTQTIDLTKIDKIN